MYYYTFLENHYIMKNALGNILLVFVFTCSSCTQISQKEIPIEHPSDVLKSLKNFLNYSNSSLKLSEDFIALDSSSKIIGKGEFLQQLSSGLYLPIRHMSNDSVYYRLYKINIPTDDYIPLLIKGMGEVEYKHYQMEGKVLPKFNFVDLEGRIYDHETTKGKTVVLKFWFIKCQKCIEEIPALNELVNQYKNRKDIVFISLALDKKKDLINFLANTSFNYAVVANQDDYLRTDLNIGVFPTHVVINKKGLVVKVVNNYEEMESILKKVSLK